MSREMLVSPGAQARLKLAPECRARRTGLLVVAAETSRTPALGARA
jgi:hypothetical protein